MRPCLAIRSIGFPFKEFPMPNLIESYRLTRFGFPRDRVIGDLQVQFDTVYMAVLELLDTAGRTGTGFFFGGFHPLPSLAELNRVFEAEVAPAFIGQSPHALTNRISRPRGGNIRGLPLQRGRGDRPGGLGPEGRRSWGCRSTGCWAARSRACAPTPAGWIFT